MMKSKRQVPTLSLSEYRNPDLRSGFNSALIEAVSEYGFVVIKDHGIAPETIERAYELSKALFELPLETKTKYEGDNGQRGYISFGKETAKGNKYPDLKEYWHIGPELDKDNYYYNQYPQNFWPKEIPEFRAFFSELYTALNDIAKSLLSAMGDALGLPSQYFEDMIQDGNSVQRLIHYPPILESDTKGSVRAAAHVDINLITLLIGATDSGLELLDKDGCWLPVNNQEGEIVVDTGDMMSRLTNDSIPATTHRVVNPKDLTSARYSIPYFVHPRNDINLSSFAQFGDPLFPPITAGDFLQERLQENGFGDSPKKS